MDEGWHLWATIQYCADLVLGDGSSAVGLRCVPRNHHELCGRLHDSHVARRRRLVCSQQSDCITSTSSKNNRYDNYGRQNSTILHTQNFETKNMSETNDKKCSLQLLTANCPKYCCPKHFYLAMLCTRGTSHGPVSVSQSVSVTSRCSTKTDKRRITKQYHTIAQGRQFSGVKDLREIRPRSSPTREPNAGGVGRNRRLLTNSWLYLDKKLSYRRGTARCVVSVEILPYTYDSDRRIGR